jgi:hypothetical protein
LDDVRALAGEVGSEHFKADVDDAGRGGEQARRLDWFAVGGHRVVRGVLMGQCFDSPYSNCVKSTSGRSPQPSQNTPPDRIFVRTRTGSNVKVPAARNRTRNWDRFGCCARAESGLAAAPGLHRLIQWLAITALPESGIHSRRRGDAAER